MAETTTEAPLKFPSVQDSSNPLGSTLQDPEKSLLRKWLATLDLKAHPDGGFFRSKRWRSIGWEVFERKSLLLASARDLEENNIPDPIKLAATDIFVEKAQRTLATRGKWLYIFGALTATLATVVLLGAAWLIFSVDVLNLLHVKASSDTVSNAYLTVVILKSTTAGAMVVAVVYLLVALSRALLHEATVLYSRRHSLRFGRLFVYLMSGTMTREDLELVFNWNAEFSTAFKDIQAETITKSPVSKVLETPADLIKAVAELRKSFAEEAKKASGENSTGAA